MDIYEGIGKLHTCFEEVNTCSLPTLITHSKAVSWVAQKLLLHTFSTRAVTIRLYCLKLGCYEEGKVEFIIYAITLMSQAYIYDINKHQTESAQTSTKILFGQ